MGRGVIRKIVGTGTIGAGIAAANAAIGNAVGPAGIATDPGMNSALQETLVKNWEPANVGTAALVGGAVGLGVGVYNRAREMKREKAARNRNLSNVQQRGNKG